MRILSFILAFGFAFAAPSFNATADSNLPGAGTFTYSSAKLETTTTVAHLTLTPRGRMLPAGAKSELHQAATDSSRG
jgi:hypothetical protein